MKKILILLPIFCLLLCSCGTTFGNSGQSNAANNTGTDGKGNQMQSAQNNSSKQQSNANNSNSGNKNNETETIKNDDASVEMLVQIGKTFISSAYSDDGDGMIGLCDDLLGGKIGNNRKLYVGTKPNYVVGKIDITIKPSEEKGKYLLYTSVDTVKKSDNKKYTFKYLIQIEKNKTQYYVTNFTTM